jgi:integrase
MTINFYLNNDPKSNKTEKAIFCYIRDSGKTLCLHVGERIEPKLWDIKGQKARRSYVGHPELNDYLNSYRERIKKIIRAAKIEDPLMPFEQIKRIILKEVKNKSAFDFFQVLDIFIETRKPLVSKSTTSKYKTIKKHIKDCCSTNNFTVTFDTIDFNFFDRLHNYFLSVEISNNTIHKNIQHIKSFLRWAYEREYTKINKFEDFKNVKEVQTDQIALTKEDMDKIINCKKLSDKLQIVRDIFLFQLYTGQRYSDISKFNMSDVKNSTWYIRQIKTKKIMEIPLIEPALQILHKYNNTLPMITNQKLNVYLKELGQAAKLNDKVTVTKYYGAERKEEQFFKHELLTTHTARRTFVSLTSYGGVNQQVVKSFTGHGTDKMVNQYFKKNNEEGRKIVEDIFNN